MPIEPSPFRVSAVLYDYNYDDSKIMNQLNKLPCIIEVNRVDGPYDIVVKLSDNNMDMLKQAIVEQIVRI